MSGAYLFRSKYLKGECVLGTDLGAKDTVVKRTDKIHCPRDLTL